MQVLKCVQNKIVNATIYLKIMKNHFLHPSVFQNELFISKGQAIFCSQIFFFTL